MHRSKRNLQRLGEHAVALGTSCIDSLKGQSAGSVAARAGIAALSLGGMFAAPPVLLWRALPGSEAVLGLLILGLWLAAAAFAETFYPPLHPSPEARRQKLDARRLALVLDITLSLIWPALATLLRPAVATPVVATAFWHTLVALVTRGIANAFPEGERIASPLFSLLSDAARGHNLLRRLDPSPNALLTTVHLALIASWAHSLFIAHLGAEIPAFASAMRAAPLADAQEKRGFKLLRRLTEEPPSRLNSKQSEGVGSNSAQAAAEIHEAEAIGKQD